MSDFPGVLAVGVGVATLAMCLQAGWAPLSFIPRAFAGTAAFFGTTLSFWPAVLALVLGLALGWASALTGDRLQRLLIKPERTPAANDPAQSVQTA